LESTRVKFSALTPVPDTSCACVIGDDRVVTGDAGRLDHQHGAALVTLERDIVAGVGAGLESTGTIAMTICASSTRRLLRPIGFSCRARRDEGGRRARP
jgi:hypothetical protein